MISTLESNLASVDDRFLNDTELRPLEEYIKSHTLRIKTYRLIQSHTEEVVLKTLRKMVAEHPPEMMQQVGQTCKRDLTNIMHYMGLCILKNDVQGFYEEFTLWMDTMMKAFKLKNVSQVDYTHLPNVVKEVFPEESAKIMFIYIDQLIEAMGQGAAV
ncbi:MAG: hypothetical protein VKJ85_08370 [Prochlorothrix sp.]|nr:hypothetical protein [Prochlorothrix sp.]